MGTPRSGSKWRRFVSFQGKTPEQKLEAAKPAKKKVDDDDDEPPAKASRSNTRRPPRCPPRSRHNPATTLAAAFARV
jgi:hypothetical protein